MAATKSKKSKPQPAKESITKDETEDSEPGCIYLGHIPHGFYEDQMKQYFSQFGHVLAVKLKRSKKTGNSKGYGFVMFKYAAVAKTVAETCHNYLFLNKLLKCEFKPMSEMRKDTFKLQPFIPKTLPKRQNNRSKSEKQLKQSVKRSVTSASKKMLKLKELGLDFDLSQVMDIPVVPDTKSTPKETNGKKGKQSEETEVSQPPGKKRKIAQSLKEEVRSKGDSKKAATPKKVDTPKKAATPKTEPTPKKGATPKKVATPQKVATPKMAVTPKNSGTPKKVASLKKSATPKTPSSAKATKTKSPNSKPVVLGKRKKSLS